MRQWGQVYQRSIPLALTVDDRGHLTAVTGPGGAAWSMAYTHDGLLTRFTDPGGDTSTFAYNENGRLVRDAAPEGGGWKLARSKAMGSGLSP